MDELLLVLRLCTQLEEAHVNVVADDATSAVKALFGYDRPLLTSLILDVGGFFGGNEDRIREMLLELSARVGNLRKIHFRGLPQGIFCFEAIARSALLLEDVSISFDFPGEIVPGFSI